MTTVAYKDYRCKIKATIVLESGVPVSTRGGRGLYGADRPMDCERKQQSGVAATASHLSGKARDKSGKPVMTAFSIRPLLADPLRLQRQ